MTTKRVLFLAAIATCSASFGCTSSDGSTRILFASLGDSTVTFAWTIDGNVDPEQCRRSGATTLDVKLETRDGGSAGEFERDCDAFATKVSIPPGSYVATAVLRDRAGRDRTAQVDLDHFTVDAEDELHVPIEFPASAFR